MSDKQTDAPQKQVHWANDYGYSRFTCWHDTRAEVDDADPGLRIAVVRREWIPGQLPQYSTEEV